MALSVLLLQCSFQYFGVLTKPERFPNWQSTLSTADEEFDELCFKFGIEIDDIVDDPDTGVAFKIEVGANRYDLLCIEGIARSLRIYLGLESPPRYKLLPAQEPQKYKLIVKPSVAQVKSVHLFVDHTYRIFIVLLKVCSL